MSLLILAEAQDGQLLASTRSAIACAQAIGGDIDVLVAGHAVQSVAQQAAAIPGVQTVLVADAEHLAHPLPEQIAPLLEGLASGYSHILAAATSHGKNILPRLAARLGVQQISDITAVLSADTFVRPIYAGSALATVQSSDPVKVITVRSTAFAAVAETGGHASITSIDAGVAQDQVTHLGSDLRDHSAGPELTTARVVVSGGRGIGSAENFQLVERLAKALGGAVGASRAAVDAGYVANDYQVGQTGKIVAPELYVAVGISGAIQHLAGMKESKIIVAINKDAEAPIFQLADYGLEADLFTASEDLIEQLGS
jgi:electron transfer flavoprotein alpha subunit